MISVIVPTYNEERVIAEAVRAILQQARTAEIVVVDGGSTDATRQLVGAFGERVRLIVQDPDGPRGRAAAYNQAARVATGDTLLFLHVDSCLPSNGLALVEQALADPSIVGGGFLPTFGEPGVGRVQVCLGWIERIWRWRTRTFQWFAGDQAPFIRRDYFDLIGGYPMVRLAEDWAFASRLRALGKLALIETPVRVSARRFLANGVMTTIFVTGSIEAMYRAGVEAPILAWWYRWWLPRERG